MLTRVLIDVIMNAKDFWAARDAAMLKNRRKAREIQSKHSEKINKYKAHSKEWVLEIKDSVDEFNKIS